MDQRLWTQIFEGAFLLTCPLDADHKKASWLPHLLARTLNTSLVFAATIRKADSMQSPYVMLRCYSPLVMLIRSQQRSVQQAEAVHFLYFALYICIHVYMQNHWLFSLCYALSHWYASVGRPQGHNKQNTNCAVFISKCWNVIWWCTCV